MALKDFQGHLPTMHLDFLLVYWLNVLSRRHNGLICLATREGLLLLNHAQVVYVRLHGAGVLTALLHLFPCVIKVLIARHLMFTLHEPQ
jgi:hypothetical protein